MNYTLLGHTSRPHRWDWQGFVPCEEQIGRLSIRDFVVLRFQGLNEAGELMREEMAVEIVSLEKGSRRNAEKMFKGKIVGDGRDYRMPFLKDGQVVSFKPDEIYAMLLWPNSKTKARVWRAVAREDIGVELHDWYGSPLPKSRLDSLRPGNVVRVIIGTDDGSWAKVYFEIKTIDYYTQGGVHRPRKFHGFVRDYYMTSVNPYVRIGEEVEFQRRHVFEIPEEFRSKVPPFQHNSHIIERERDHRRRIDIREGLEANER